MIHPSAIISPEAQIDASVEIGPFSIVEGPVRIAANCKIGAHVWLKGPLEIAENNQIGYGSIIGGDPQDHSFKPDVPGGTRIGAGNTIREYVTIHRNTIENGWTQVGENNFLMTGAHLAHDVMLGNHNTLANNVLVAGHVHFGNHAFIGGGAVFHQFIRVGDYAIAQGNSGFSQDLPPFCLGHSVNKVSGLNIVGMRRARFSPEERRQVKAAYKAIFHAKEPLSKALPQALEQLTDEGPARRFLEFFQSPSRKGVLCRES